MRMGVMWWVLDQLKLMEGVRQEGVTVVQARSDKGVDKDESGIGGRGGTRTID